MNVTGEIRARDAILARRAPEPDLVVRYGPHPDQVADVRLPAGTAPAPLVLFLHGGYWRHDIDRAHAGPLATDLAGRGHLVANVEYRRPGPPGNSPVSWTDTLGDVAAALDRLPDLAAAAAPGRVDPDRVYYAGHSAGGHLALWGAVRHRLPAGALGRLARPPRLRGVFALAAVCDLTGAYRQGLGENAVRDLMGADPEGRPEWYAAADPQLLPAPEVPVTLVHGTLDGRVPVQQSRRYAAKVGGRLVELPDSNHYWVIDPGSPAWPAVVRALSELVAGPAGAGPPGRS